MDTKELNALKDRAYKTAIAHGFHEEERPDAFWLSLVMSEMGEAINADRKEMHADTKGFIHYMDATKFYYRKAFDSYIKDSLEDELADIVIRLFDFAGLKRYELDIASIDHVFSRHRILEFWDYKLPGILVRLITMLADASNEDELQQYVGTVICVLSDGFERMTGSDKDLWWFVKQKMRYNELRPNSKGETEKEKFHDLLHGFGLEWDDRNGQIVSYRWKPQEGDVYYYIDTDGSVIREIWHDKSGVRSLSFGNCFPNRKLAGEMAGKIREMLNNKDIIAKINNDAL